jgi:hypothetical protein
LYENSAEYGIKVSGFIGTQSDETWSSDVLFQFPGTGKFYAISVEGKVETFNSYYDRLYVEYTNRFKEGNFQRIKFPTITHRNLNGGGQIIVEDGEIESIGDEWADEYRLRDEADLGDYVETSIIRIFAPPPCPTFILLRFDTRDSKHQVGGRLRLTARIRTSFQGKWINPEDFYL